jgi:transmembrane sensor
MSDVSFLENSAAGINMRAAVWLERENRKEWCREDQLELETWLDEAPAHRLAYWRVKGAWDHANRLSVMRTPDSGQTIKPPNRAIWFGSLRVVTGLVVIAIVLAATGSFLFSGSSDRAYSTAVGARQTIVLSDGSRIELNTDSALRVVENAQRREVRFDRGEAYFQIRHDTAHPFVVQVRDHRVTDLGTKFLVREHADRVEVALIEGRARVEAVSARIPALAAVLAPGDLAIVNANSIVVTRKSAQSMTDELGWRRGLLVFRRTPLAEAVAEFNRYNRRKIVIADADVARLQIGGTFQANNPKVFARVTQDILGLRADDRGSETVISR